MRGIGGTSCWKGVGTWAGPIFVVGGRWLISLVGYAAIALISVNSAAW